MRSEVVGPLHPLQTAFPVLSFQVKQIFLAKFSSILLTVDDGNPILFEFWYFESHLREPFSYKKKSQAIQNWSKKIQQFVCMLLFGFWIDASESWGGTLEPVEQLFGPPEMADVFVVHPKSCRSKKLGYATCFNLIPLGCQKFLDTLVSTMATNQTTKLSCFCVSTAAIKR